MYFVLVSKAKSKHTTIEEIEKLFKTSFKNKDYLDGFCDGYLFSTYRILTPTKFKEEFNTVDLTSKYYLLLAYID